MDAIVAVQWVIGVEIALAGVIAAFMGYLHNRRKDQMDDLIAPIKTQLKHQDDCMDDVKEAVEKVGKEANDFRRELQEELKSMSSQFTGILFGITERYSTKAELEGRFIEINNRITQIRNGR